LLTKLILKTLDPELKVFVAAAEDMLSQAFKSTCGRVGLHSSFHEDTAKSYQPFTSRLYCIKETWKGAPACPSVHPNSNKVSKQIQQKTHTAWYLTDHSSTYSCSFVDPTAVQNISPLWVFLLPKLGRRASQLMSHYKIKLYFIPPL